MHTVRMPLLMVSGLLIGSVVSMHCASSGTEERVSKHACYDQKALFTQKEDGSYACFELQEQIDLLNREFEDRKRNLQTRSRALKTQEIDNTDPEQMGTALKEQSALEIDAKLLQQEYQMRMGKVQGAFLQEVRIIIDELAKADGWDIIQPIDFDVAFVADKLDVTKKIVARLNDKFRAKQRAKKFSDAAKKEQTAKKAVS